MDSDEDEYVYSDEDEDEGEPGAGVEEDENKQEGEASSPERRERGESVSSLSGGKGKGGGAAGKFRVTDSATKLLDAADVEEAMLEKVNEVSELLSLTNVQAEALLQHTEWSSERLMDAYWDNPEKVLGKVGIERWEMEPADERPKHPADADSGGGSGGGGKGSAGGASSAAAGLADANPQSGGSAGDGEGERPPPLVRVRMPPCASAKTTCRICFGEFGPAEVMAAPCEHFFCRECYHDYLCAKVDEGPSVIYTTCPEHKCTTLLPRDTFGELVPAASFAKYERFRMQSFVNFSRSMRWCPSPGCSKVVLGGQGVKNVRCAPGGCGAWFCFKCGDAAHQPAGCAAVATWTEKCQNESETANWILANTRRCPKCHTRIEKNQGCNHMSCTQCKYEFCWVCMGPWSDHGANTGGYYKCNKFDPSKPVEGEDDATKAKRELDRYLHYYKRYHGHHAAQNFAEKQLATTEKRMIELQESTAGSWIDVQFLKSANEMVVDCRRTLKFTYVFGYYLPQDDEEGRKMKELFEDLQEHLERMTETLSEMTELPLEKMDRAEIVNTTRVTEHFLNNLIRGVDHGLADDEAEAKAAAATIAAGESKTASA